MFGQCAATLAPLSATIAPLSLEAREAIDTIVAMGYRAVQWSATQTGMRPRDLDASSRRGIVTHLRRLGLACSGVDLFIPSGHFFDAAQVDRAMDAAERAAELGRDFGCCPISIALPEATASNLAALAPIRAALAEIADRARVRFVDFSLAAAQGDASSQNDAIGIGIDPPVLLAAQTDVAGAVARAGPRLACARVCDLLCGATRAPAGEPADAQLDLLAYVAALSVAGLKSNPVADARQWTDPRRGLEETLQRWQGQVTA